MPHRARILPIDEGGILASTRCVQEQFDKKTPSTLPKPSPYASQRTTNTSQLQGSGFASTPVNGHFDPLVLQHAERSTDSLLYPKTKVKVKIHDDGYTSEHSPPTVAIVDRYASSVYAVM